MSISAAIDRFRSKRFDSGIKRCNFPTEASERGRLRGQATNAAKAAERVRVIGPVALQLKEEGLSLAEIAAVMDEMGHRNPVNGKPYTRFQVRNILDRVGG